MSDQEYLLDVAVAVHLNQTFTYRSTNFVYAGCRVTVPFGPRKLIGVVIGSVDVAPQGVRLRHIESIIDETPYFREPLIQIAKWMSEYYIHPLGMTFQTMMPAVTQKKKIWSLTAQGLSAKQTEDHPQHTILNELFLKKEQLSHTTFLKKCKTLDITPLKLSRLQLVSNQSSSFVREHRLSAEQTDQIGDTPKTLTNAQSQALQGIREAQQPSLLFGVTGSGKTELYLRLIQDTLDQDPNAQILMLVPEISLTPQITAVFAARFPGQIVTTHSRLSDNARAEAIEQIRQGKRSILIGPRSALFAPFRNLKRILVDEEHDHSYKQGSGLTYHGRDVAVLLSKLERIPITLGSATPSMESWRNAQENRYTLISLTERVSNRPLPPIDIVEATHSHQIAQALPQELQHMDESWVPLHPDILEALQKNHEQGGQTILLVNRRGYAFHLMNPRTKEVLQCPRCSVSLTLHRKLFQLRCHYCDYQQSLEAARKSHGPLIAVGYGSQKVEETLKRALSPEVRIARLDSDNARDSLTQTLEDFRAQKYDILVGTQLLAKGHDFPQVTLVVLLDIHQSLNLPDFRAGERTFQLLVQAAGRAGRGEKPGRVMGQGSLEDPRIQMGLAHNFIDFANIELGFRKAHKYPPYSRLIRIELNSENKERLDKHCAAIRSWIDQLEIPETSIVGPAPTAIEKIHHRYRQALLLSSEHTGYLRRAAFYILESWPPPPQIRMIVDVDPQDLL